MLTAGERNRSIKIQEQSGGQDAAGQYLDDWATVWPCWARIRGITTKTQQKFSAAGFTAQLSHMVSIMFPRSVVVRSKMRVLYGARVFEILYVEDPDEGRVQLDLYCMERNEGEP